MKPGTGGRPIALHRGGTNFQCFRNFLQREPCKEAQFHNFALSRIDYGESF
jgi:hypothetical protein